MKANVFTKTGEVTVTGWRILDMREDNYLQFFGAPFDEEVFGGPCWYYIAKDGFIRIAGSNYRFEVYERENCRAIVRPVILFDGELPVGSYVEFKGIPYCVFESRKAIAMGGIDDISALEFYENMGEDWTYETVLYDYDEEVSLKSVVDNYFS